MLAECSQHESSQQARRPSLTWPAARLAFPFVSEPPTSCCSFHSGYAPSADTIWLGKPVSEVREAERLLPGEKTLTAEQRAALWDEFAPAMSELATRRALENWKGGKVCARTGHAHPSLNLSSNF